MTTRMLVMGGVSALLLGGTMVGCTAGGGKGIASASNLGAGRDIKAAQADANRAGKALARQDAAAAIGPAERAVALAPRDVGYRLLLGQSYLRAGRFASARSAFGDALTLEPGNGKAALNLALAQIATGDWSAARATLADCAAAIPVADHGLALALAGDPDGGAAMLTELVRSPQTSAKARQNLALALALAGKWSMARVVAAADLSPAEIDSRMEQWAAFAQPARAADQVAGLLGVRPAVDAGQPIALALNAPATPAAAADSLAKLPVVEAPVVVDAAPPMLAANTAPSGGVVFARRQEVVQPLPPRLIRSDAGTPRMPLASARSITAAGGYVVQIGAFGSADGARDAWGRATRRFPALARHDPRGMNVRARAGQLYRLSVGGFARADADAFCRRYRESGGVCFVRGDAGDRMAQWLRPAGLQFAAR